MGKFGSATEVAATGRTEQELRGRIDSSVDRALAARGIRPSLTLEQQRTRRAQRFMLGCAGVFLLLVFVIELAHLLPALLMVGSLPEPGRHFPLASFGETTLALTLGIVALARAGGKQ